MTQWGLDTLFNPGKRHMDDEKRRLQSTREEIGDSSGGRRIDLESGRVAISVNRGPAATDDAVDDDHDDDHDEVSADEELEPALEAEDVPAVALANDEAEIEPALVDEAPEPPPVDEVPEPQTPVAAPTPEVEPERAPSRPTRSAQAWSRRG